MVLIVHYRIALTHAKIIFRSRKFFTVLTEKICLKITSELWPKCVFRKLLKEHPYFGLESGGGGASANF